MPSVSFYVVQDTQRVGSEIRPGDTVVLEIMRHLGGSNWRVSYRGHALTIESEIPLVAGSSIRTRAVEQGSRIFLKFQPDNAGKSMPATAVASREPPADRLSGLLIQALQRTGQRITPSILTRSRSVFEKLKSKNSTTAGIIALLWDKGIEPNVEMVEMMYGFCDGYHFHERNREKRPFSSESDADTVEDIKLQLKRQIENKGNNAELLQLFNHMAGARENWIVIPYHVQKNGESIDGSIRLRTGNDREINRVVFDTNIPEGDISFSASWPLRQEGLRVTCSNSKLSRAVMKNRGLLGEKHHNLILINDDNNIDNSYDRFCGEYNGTLKGVNRLV